MGKSLRVHGRHRELWGQQLHQRAVRYRDAGVIAGTGGTGGPALGGAAPLRPCRVTLGETSTDPVRLVLWVHGGRARTAHSTGVGRVEDAG